MILTLVTAVVAALIIIYLLHRPPKKEFVYPKEISIRNFIEEASRILATRSYLLYRIGENGITLETNQGCPKPDFQPQLDGLSHEEERYLKKNGFRTMAKVAFRGERLGYLVVFPVKNPDLDRFQGFVQSYTPLLVEKIKTEEKILEASLINELNIKLGTTEDPESFYRNLVTVARRILTQGRIIPAEVRGKDLIFYLLRRKEIRIPIVDLPDEIMSQVIVGQKTVEITTIPEPFKKNLPIHHAHSGLLVPLTTGKRTLGILFYYKRGKEIEPKERTILGFISNQAMIILDKMFAMKNLNRSIQDIIALQKSAQALLVIPKFEEIIDQILKEASRIIGFQRIILSFYNPETNCLDRVGSIGFEPEEWERIRKISPPFFRINNLLKEEYRISNSYYLKHNCCEIAEVKDFLVRREKPAGYPEELPSGLWHPNDILLIPIRTGDGKFLGLISADSPLDGQVPDISRLQVFETFATLLGLSFENAEAFKKLRRLVDKLRSLYNITAPISSVGEFEKVLNRILNLTKENFGYNNISILLKDDEKDELYVKVAVGDYLVDPSQIRLKIGRDGVCGMVAQEGKPKLIQNTLNIPFFIGDRDRPRSEIAIPLRSHDRLIGVLNVEKEGANSLDEEDLTLLSILAGHISVAIENAILYEEIGRLSITDELTGVFNYRHLLDVIKYEIERSRRFQHSFSLIMLDIDNFKKFNDQYGHLFGDQILSALAKLLASSVRASDIVTRYGGDEFVIVLPETTKEQALILAERLRNIVNQHTFEKNVHLTVSMGLASYPIDSQDVFPLIDRVDHLLYISKSKGGNAVSS
ncbi:hypothetical protein DRP53_06335 [candidate division WOR-3 bacterium]|uniref:GGDEF domain-containing protein n=1 Tax=candidate division WOR-3 bacterium TaxID=2052148 RepID=A0A660SIT0_UNCW3|nr:MAG: hypothetical protein DRP53_06335 [candidate division WOR-3 bacterium]